jgi:serine/threonine protein kinase
MPPHDMYADEAIDIRGDIWNVGRIMFELMEQQRVHIDTPTPNIVHSLRYRRRRRVYSPELDALIMRCLATNPNTRPNINRLLYDTKQGLEDWENAYQSVNDPNIPACFTWPWAPEDFPIGTTVPSHWNWATRHRQPDGDSDDDSDGDSNGSDYQPDPRRRKGLSKRKRHEENSSDSGEPQTKKRKGKEGRALRPGAAGYQAEAPKISVKRRTLTRRPAR